MEGFCPLASGSKGNCIYFGTKEYKILIDAGLSARAITQKLQQINISINEIDAIIITHEHGDHIRGLKVLAFRNEIPVFANAETAKGIIASLKDCPKFKIFSTGEAFTFGDMEIRPFQIQHDTPDPVAFTISYNNIKCGFCTDLGFVTPIVRNHLKNCDYLYLEANHEPDMVHACPRPMLYKQRVLSRQGHLSNEACAQLLLEITHPGLKHVHLAHLSSECNHPDKALEVIQSILLEANISLEMTVVLQDQICTPIYFTESIESKSIDQTTVSDVAMV